MPILWGIKVHFPQVGVLVKYVISFSLLVLMAAASRSAEIYGVVERPPVKSESAARPTRYRSSFVADPAQRASDCQCNPGLYSVIALYPLEAVSPAGFGDTLELTQKGKAFEPSVLAVAVNSTVSFPNLDPFYHNVFSYSKTKRFDLGKYNQNKTRYITFDKPGIVHVFCEIHYSMRAYVHVLETDYFVVSDENGKFHISGVPRGKYSLNVWQEGQSDIRREINLQSDSLWLELN